MTPPIISHCWYCGRQIQKGVDLTRDHVVSVVREGSGLLTVDACQKCNVRKGSKSMEQFRMEQAKTRRMDSSQFRFAGELYPHIGRMCLGVKRVSPERATEVLQSVQGRMR